MVLIYSTGRVKGLEDGFYRSPQFFNGVDIKASKVYSDDEEISNAYKEIGIEVSPIKAKKTKPKKEDKKEDSFFS